MCVLLPSNPWMQDKPEHPNTAESKPNANPVAPTPTSTSTSIPPKETLAAAPRASVSEPESMVPRPSMASIAPARRPSGVEARVAFVLPKALGEFEYNVKGRAFRALRRFNKVLDDSTVMPVALIVCNDVMFLCTPSGQPGEPMILLHRPPQRCDVKAEAVTSSQPLFRLLFPGNHTHLLETTSEKEAQYWVRTINLCDGYVSTDSLGK